MQRTRANLAAALSLACEALCCAVGYGESLEDAWALALAQNHRLAAVHIQVEAAAHQVAAATAERLPSLSLRSGYTLRSDEPSFVVRDPLPGLGRFEFPYAQQHGGLVGAEVQLPLYTAGRITTSVRSAESRHTAAKLESEQARLELLLAVGQAYVAVLQAQHAVEAFLRESASADAHAADVVREFERGRLSASDSLAAQAAAASVRQRSMQQQRTLEVARARYNRLLGRPLETALNLEEIELAPLPWSYEQLMHVAYERRPDLQALLATAESHQFASRSERAVARPQVVGSVGIQYEENRYGDPQSLATAAVIVDWKLYDGGRSGRAADAEATRADSVRRMVDDLKSQIAVDMLEAWNQMANAAEEREVTSQMLAYAAEQLRVSRLRFGQDVAIGAAVLDAQAQWSQALRDDLDAHYRGILAQLLLRYHAGLY